MAGTLVNFETAAMDVRWADLAGAFGFATGKGAVRRRVDMVVMEQAG